MSSKKEKILQAAFHLFARNGYNETSVATVAEQTGAAEGTIFYHFKSKEEMFLTILERIKNDISAAFERFLAEHRFDTGLDMLERTISFYLNLASTQEETFLLLHHRYPYDLATVNPVCREHLEGIYNCFVDILERAVRRGQADGSIVDATPRKKAMIIYALIDGVVRFNHDNLYHAGTLYDEVLQSCRRMLARSPMGA
jgi:AcrR family transcriptional regulator